MCENKNTTSISWEILKKRNNQFLGICLVDESEMVELATDKTLVSGVRRAYDAPTTAATSEEPATTTDDSTSLEELMKQMKSM